METLRLYLLLVLSILAAQSMADPDLLSLFMKSNNENQHSRDVPYVNFDDLAFETLKSDALSTTTTTTTTTSTTTTSTTSTTTEATTEATTSTTAKPSTTAKDKSKKKKRHGRKHRSRIQ